MDVPGLCSFYKIPITNPSTNDKDILLSIVIFLHQSHSLTWPSKMEIEPQKEGSVLRETRHLLQPYAYHLATIQAASGANHKASFQGKAALILFSVISMHT